MSGTYVIRQGDAVLATTAATVMTNDFSVGVNDTGHDVKFFGATAGRYWLWDESADGVVQIGTLTVGVNDTGHDVKFFGATATKYWLWDESADKMIVVGDAQFTGAVTVGVDDTGHDVKFFGATAGAYWLWDESADTVLRDGGTLLVKAVASGDAGMTVSADGMTADPETAQEAGFIAVDIAGTGYQIPIYAA